MDVPLPRMARDVRAATAPNQAGDVWLAVLFDSCHSRVFLPSFVPRLVGNAMVAGVELLDQAATSWGEYGSQHAHPAA